MDPAVVRLREAGLARSRADAELVAAARGVVEAVRARAAQRRGLAGGGTGTGSGGLAAVVRRTAVGELEVALGLGEKEARTLLTAATAPGDLYATVREALVRGEVDWASVARFYRRTSSLEVDQQVLVASVLMGTDARVAAADRLDPDGALHGRPWSEPRFRAALEAEVAACRGTDPQAERLARRRAYEARSLRVRVHEDGTATMYVHGAAPTVVAAGERADRAARRLRQLGDPRTLAQLRTDLALGLLLYATIDLGRTKKTNPAPDSATDSHGTADQGTDDYATGGHGADGPGPQDDGTTESAGTDHDTDGRHGATGAGGAREGCCCTCDDGEEGQGVLFDELLAPEDLQALARVVNAQPPVALQVVVPLTTLAGGFPVCAHCSGPLDAPHPQPRTRQADDEAGHGDRAGQDDRPGHGDGVGQDLRPPPPPWAGEDPAHYQAGPASSGRWEESAHQPPDHQAGQASPGPGEDSAQHPPDHQAGPASSGPGEESAHHRAGPASPGPGEESAQHPPEGSGWESVLARTGPGTGPGREGDCDHPQDGPQGGDRGGRRGRARPDGTRRGGRGGCAEVLGSTPFFITDGHARELALLPGTTLHRLVTDPRDGRLVERTIKTYEPDTDMRRQVIAADVYSRAPGPRTGSRAGEIDHVTPHGWAGGPTCETNLALLARRPHRYKTDKHWHVTIGARRDLTFTTLLGQVTTTRVHDYRTYLDQRGHEDLADQRDAATQLYQAALADQTRPRTNNSDNSKTGTGTTTRKTGDRHPGLGDWLDLDHTDPTTGNRRRGPHPDQPTLDDLLHTPEDSTDTDDPRPGDTDGVNPT